MSSHRQVRWAHSELDRGLDATLRSGDARPIVLVARSVVRYGRRGFPMQADGGRPSITAERLWPVADAWPLPNHWDRWARGQPAPPGARLRRAHRLHCSPGPCPDACKPI